MKKTKKILIALMCFTILATAFVSVYATTIDGVTIKPNTTGKFAKTAGNVANQITGAIKVVGIILSVALLMILGVKYMMGSVEEKAEYKKTMVPYLIGAVLVFGASVFASQIYDFASQLMK